MSLLLHQGNSPQWSIRSDTTKTRENTSRPKLHQSPRHPNEIENLMGSWQYCRWSPPADITENDHAITILMDVPGLRGGLEVVIEHGLISISGCRSYSDDLTRQHSDQRLCRQERPAGQFTRHFKLPVAVNSGHMHTSYKDGVLCVSLPKAPKHSIGNQRVWVSVTNNTNSAQN